MLDPLLDKWTVEPDGTGRMTVEGVPVPVPLRGAHNLRNAMLALAAARPQQVTRVVGVSTMGAPGAPLSADLDAIWAAPAGPRPKHAHMLRP